MKIKLTFLIILISLLAIGQEDSIKAKSFSVPEYDDKGKLICLIKGDTGDIFGKEALINGAIVEIRNKKNPLLLKTPKCKYLLKDKRCTSNENLKITGDGITITGKGFDIDNNTRKIFIRSNVKVVWKKKNLKKDDTKTEKKDE